jgi:hypothetical protein
MALARGTDSTFGSDLVRLEAMNKAMEEVARDATQLPRHQRLALARFLLEMDAPATPTGIEAEWDAEIRERIRSVEEGRSEALPYAEVLARVDRRLGP